MPDDEVLVRDIFPAEVVGADGSLITKARVFVTSHRLIVWREQPLGIAVEESLAPFSIRASRDKLNDPLKVGTYLVNQGRGCGCGSKLTALAKPAPWEGA